MSPTLLETRGLSMRFGGLTAVDKVDLQITSGQIFSVIGPNGAGKTTLFNAITGLYEPTEGSILFAGRRLRRPFSWKVALSIALIAMLTGLASLLMACNVDKLWLATIRRPYQPNREFQYSTIFKNAIGFLNGDLAVEPQGRIVTSGGEIALTVERDPEKAERLRGGLQELLDQGITPTITRQGDKPTLLSASGESLLEFRNQSAVDTFQNRFEQVAAERGKLIPRAWMAWLIGTLVGAAGTYTVWSRTRSTTDYVSLGGLSRTFQNVRLFQNMTVVENVLIGMDRSFHSGALGAVFRTPRWRREEQSMLRRAHELLEFVGLTDQLHDLAKNLPYGSQRRLEIARALAANPRLLLLDEPAAGMNPAETKDLMLLIEKIRQNGHTILLIEHHISLVMGISDRIAVLEYGRKIAEGTPEEIRTNPRVIEAYLGSDVNS